MTTFVTVRCDTKDPTTCTQVVVQGGILPARTHIVAPGAELVFDLLHVRAVIITEQRWTMVHLPDEDRSDPNPLVRVP